MANILLDYTLEKSAKFWDKIADGYAKRPVRDEVVYQKKLAITQEYFRQDMEVLEIGCGTGSTAIAHAPHVKHLHAIDISSRMIEIAEEKAKTAGVCNLSFERSKLEDYSFPDKNFDAILALSLLHLVSNPEQLLEKIYASLAPHGIFVSSTPCIGDHLAFLKYLFPIGSALGVIPKVEVFSESRLVQSMTKIGFSIAHHWRPNKGAAVFIVAKKTG